MNPKKILFPLYFAILLHLITYTIPNSPIGLIAPAWGQENDIDDNLEDDIDTDTEDEVEDDQEDQIEDDIDDNVEDEVEDDQEDQIEDDIDDTVEDEVEDDQEDEIDDDMDDSFEDDLEDDIDDDLEDRIEDQIEFRIESDIEDDQEDEIDDDIEDDQEDEIDDDIEDDQEDEIDDDIDDDQEDEIDDDIDDNQEDEDEIDQVDVIDRISSDLVIDDFGFSRVRGVWLIMTDKETLQALEQFEFKIISSSDLEGLDKVLVEVVEPDDSDLNDIRNLLYSVLPDADVTIDYNHSYIYGPEISPSKRKDISPDNYQQRQPHKLLPLPRLKASPIKIGIIDSHVDQQHEALKNTTITAKSFVESTPGIPNEHGTAVASIIAGQSTIYRGLLTIAELYSASVFNQQSDSEQNAKAINLILSLDWMAKVGVDVINMSLAGPPNAILKAALKKLHEQGVVIVAAAGNNGPVGSPLYPAAYDFVVAVTAVTPKNIVYAMANRGAHIDLAAPGVNIQHATTKDTLYRHSSGTSLAAPFVTAKTAWLLASQKSPSSVADTTQSILNSIYQSTMDLGEPGHDDVYGHGLIQVPTHINKSKNN